MMALINVAAGTGRSWRLGFYLTALALLFTILTAPVCARDVEAEKEKIKGDNLAGIVVTNSTNTAPGSLPYEPLEGVVVKVQGTDFQMVTDEHGVFNFRVKPGDYVVTFTKDGVGMVTRNVTVKNGLMPTMLTVTLNPGMVSADERDFAPGGFYAQQSPGTAYIAFAQKSAPGAPAGSTPAGGYNVTTTQTYRQMIMLGGDPFSMGGGNVPSMPNPGDIKSGDFRTSSQVAPNSLMMLNADNPGNPAYTELKSQPYWTVFNAAGTRLYVSTANRQIQVYDVVNQNRLMTSIPASGVVTDLKLSQNGNYVLASVMCAASNILMIDTTNNAPQRSVPVPAMTNSKQPGYPRSVAVNREGSRMYILIGNSTSGEIAAVDLYTGIPQGVVAVGANPTAMELTPDGRFIYAVNSGSGDVSVVDAWTFQEMGRIRVGVSPQKVAISPDGTRVFVTNKGNDCVTVIDGQSQAPIATVPVGKGPVGVAVSNDGSRAYVCCTGSSVVSVLDGKTGGVLQTTSPLPNSVPWGVTVKP